MDAMNNNREKGKGGHYCNGRSPTAGINICNMSTSVSISGNSTCNLGLHQVKPHAMASGTGPEGQGEDDAADATQGKKAAVDAAKRREPPSGTPPKISKDGMPTIGYHLIPEHEREITMEHARNYYASRWVFQEDRHQYAKPWDHQEVPEGENLKAFMLELNRIRSEIQKEAARAGKRHVIKNFTNNR